MRACPECDVCFPDAMQSCPADSSKLEAVVEGSLLIDGKYAVEKRLGQGGMGVVYRARHIGVDRSFAVKLMRGIGPEAADWMARFRTEAAALGRLKHPGIVDVTDFGIDPREGGVPYLVMEHLEGETLANRCTAAGALELDEALPILTALADAIDFAHQSGVLHRDLKPANVFLQADGTASPRAKILDFGLARLVERPLEAARPPRPGPPPVAVDSALGTAAPLVTGTVPTVPVSAPALGEDTWSRPADARFASSGEIAGTLSYMAPELLRGREASRASDLYAFGVLAYELLVGDRPARGTPEEVIAAHFSAEPVPPSVARPRLPAEIDGPLASALAKDPARRPPSARDYVRAVRRAAQAARVREWRAREIPRRLAIAAALGVAAVAVAVALARTGPGEDLEAKTVDARFALLPVRPLNPALALVVLDEESLRADPTPLPQRADEFARRVDALYAAGARAVALDYILPPTWARSAALSRAVLAHADRTVLAALATPGGEILGPEVVAGLTATALGPERTAQLFGLTNLITDADGVVRRARLRFPTAAGEHHESFAARAAAALLGASPTGPEVFWIDHTADWSHVSRVAWKDLEHRMQSDPAAFRGRLVLFGADYLGSGDVHRLPARKGTPAEAPGVVVQSVILDTILRGFPYREGAAGPLMAASALGAAAMAAMVLCFASVRPALATAALLALAGLGIPLIAFRAGMVVPSLTPLAALALAALLAVLLRTRLSRIPTMGEAQ